MRKISFLSLLTLILVNASLSVADNSLCSTADVALVNASSIRNLKIKSKVPCTVENKDKVRAFLLERVSEEIGEERLLQEGAVLKKLGLIPKGVEYKNLIVSLYEDQVAGYYDNVNKRFVMASWLQASVQEGIAVHEQTHALQDQHYDLTRFMDHKTMSSDELFARSALVEGDASAVMFDFTNKALGLPAIAAMESVNAYVLQNVLGTGLLADSNPAAAHIVKLMIFPYTSGLHFVHALLRDGGYDAVDRSFKIPPASTEEILHPEKYGKEKRAVFSHKVLNANKGARHQDTYGEFFLTLFLKAHGISGEEASKAASGWGNDLLFLHEKEIAWYHLWDSKQERDEFYAITSNALRKAGYLLERFSDKGVYGTQIKEAL